MDQKKQMQVICPFCGYKMPIFYESTAESRGVHVICKGRNCKREFEVTIQQGQQVK